MRTLALIGLLGLAACWLTACSPSGAGGEAEAQAAAQPMPEPPAPPPASPPAEAAAQPGTATEAAGPFAGSWQACEGADTPDQCSRYLLQQRGNRICGTWSYFASGDGYEGRVVAEAASPTQARRTRICGRPGSETRTECGAGWETIDKPLRLCDGKLGDLDGKDGECFADYERVEGADQALADLAAQPWMQACLAGTAQGAGP